MKKHIVLLISLLFIVMAFSAKADASSLNNNREIEKSCIFDSQKSDIELIFNTTSDGVFVLELQYSLPSPSFRHISSQKKIQHNLTNSMLLKRFSSEVQPTKNYNTKFSFPLSSKDDLIVIVRHLII